MRLAAMNRRFWDHWPVDCKLTLRKTLVSCGGALPERLEELKLECLSAVALFDDLDRATPGARAYVEQLLALADAPLTVVAGARPQNVARLGVRCLSQGQSADRSASVGRSRDKRLCPKEPGECRSNAAGLHARTAPGGCLSCRERAAKVNQLAQLALLAGAAHELVQIDAETMDAVDEELSAAR